MWVIADVVVGLQCWEEPWAHLEFLTAWSHLASLIAHYPILWYLCVCDSDGYCHSYLRTIAVLFFCASGVLLAAILVTFFVVVLINDELFSERVDVATLGHYNYLNVTGQLHAQAAPFENSLYFEQRGFDKFTTIGKMVTYNNIRHVLPAVLHLLITMQMPNIRSELTTLTSTPCSLLSTIVGTSGLAVALPVIHFYFQGATGERDLYRASPSWPAFTMGVSIVCASAYYASLGDTVSQENKKEPSREQLYTKLAITPVIRF